MTLTPLPAFTDNYIWCLVHEGRACVIDPGEADPVQAHLAAHGLQLDTILITHHHADHTGGVAALLARWPQATVYAPRAEPLAQAHIGVAEGSTVRALGLVFTVLDVPGHTLGHVAYFAADAQPDPLLFCGDALFSAGCGRLFEGTPAQAHASLRKLAALPDNTQVCCAHEYTLTNLRFAALVEPDSPALAAHTVHCLALREAGLPTLPSTIALENRLNPFLRTDRPDIAARAAQHAGQPPGDALTTYARLRAWRDTFR